MNTKLRRGLLAAAAFAGLATFSSAVDAARKSDNSEAIAQLQAQLPGTLINDPTSLDWSMQGKGMKVSGITGGDIPGGGAAARYDVKDPGPDPWSQQVYVPLTENIANGDVVTVGFWARAAKLPDGAESGTLSVRFQENVKPWPGFGDTEVAIGPEWKWHEVSVTASVDVSRHDGVLVFQLGAAKQQLEIGQTIVIKGADSIAG
jgi:hypothetical protein